MSIPNNELWVQAPLLEPSDISHNFVSGFTETLVTVTKNSDNWLIMTFDSDITQIPYRSFYSYYITGLKLPDSITIIGEDAFAHLDELTTLNLPTSLEIIGEYAFNGCRGLTSIVIPDSVTSMGDGAFCDCDALESVEIGSGVTSIGYNTFWGCNKLKSVVIPDSVTSIGEEAFYSCLELTSIVIPDSVTSIGNGAFWHCSGLTSVVFGSGVTSIGQEAFSDCTSLTSLEIGSGVTSIGFSAFANCTALTKVIIPDSVISIGSTVFYECRKLRSVEIGSGCTSIGERAFYNCRSLREITCHALVAPTIYSNTFTIDSKYGTLNYPNGADYSSWLSTRSYYLGYYSWNFVPPEGEKYLVVVYNITDTTSKTKLYGKANSFSSMLVDGLRMDLTSGYTFTSTGLHEVKYVMSYNYIYSNTFLDCENIVEVTLPDSIVRIDNYAFEDCINLEKVTLNEGLTKINGYVFWRCESLKEITFPSTLVEIGYRGFEGCSSLKEIVLPDSISILRDYVFSKCTSLTSVTLNQTLTYIPYGAFYDCSSLLSISFPDVVTVIQEDAFYNCTSLSSIDFGSVQKIGRGAFHYCIGLTDIVLPDTVRVLGDPGGNEDNGMSFENCNSLTAVTIGTGLTQIDGYTFYGCDNLKLIITHAPKVPSTSYDDNLYNISFKGIARGGVLIPAPNTDIEAYKNEWLYNSEYTLGYYGWNLPSIELEYYELNAPAEGLTTTLNITTPGITGLDIEYPSWIKITERDGYYDIVILPNEGEPRTGEVIFSGDAYGLYQVEKILVINQEGGEPKFEIEYHELEVPAMGMVITLDFTAELIRDIYVEGTWWVKVREKDGYFEVDILANDGLPRNCELKFVGITPSNNRIEQILTINQEGIEDMATSIALYKMRLDYPAEGGYGYVQVDYTNPGAINAPYCSQSWVTIEQTQAGTAIDGNNTIYQRQYKITMAPTSFARQVNVKFSCTTPTGAEVSTDKLMLYQAGPTVNPDDGEGVTKVSPYSVRVKVKIDGTPEYSSGSNLGVGYENLIPGVPDVDSTWIHLGAGVEDTGVSQDDIVMRYPANYDVNEGPERTGYITWRGYDANGVEYTGTTEVIQYGSDTPVDEGMIELQSLSVTLPAEGGSDTFVVKYYDAKTIYEPEFVGDWGVISEVSRSTENGVAFNGEECLVTTVTYRVTGQATDAGRQAKVILRADINYYDGGVISMEKDKFRVIQLAPGASEVGGTVYPFRSTLEFDYKGLPESWGSVKVGYKDVAIGTPTIDVNWFRISETIDRTYSSKEYDYIYEYDLEVDENDTLFSREGTITFEGENEDGTKTRAIVKVIQKGGEINPDDGVHTNYKGYFRSIEDCTLYSVSFITNPNYDSFGEITLAGDSPVTVSYTTSSRLYDPIRTSTCTVRVVSKSYLMNLYTGKAQGTQVILRNEDTGEIEWCGFLQPNMYNQGYCDEVETIEFEASDCLNTLQYLKYENYFSNGRMSVPFSYVISDMLDKAKLINSYYITNKFFADGTMSRSMNFNNFYISEYNFFSEEDEPWTLKEVLEEICKYFGYVCYQWGDAIYFIDYDKYASDGSMLGYKYEKSTHWRTSTYLDIATEANYITADSYKETGADMSLDDVFNKVSVNCNYYHIEDVIPDLFNDDLLTNRMENDGYFKIARRGMRGNEVLLNETYYRVYDHRDVTHTYYAPISTAGYSHETKTTPTPEQMAKRDIIENFVGANIVDMIHLNYNEANGKVGESKDWQRYLLISQLNRPWCGAEGTFHWEEYNLPIIEFKNIPTIFIDNTEKSTGRPGMKVKPKNYLVINAEAAFVQELKNAFLNEDAEKGMSYKRTIGCYIYQDTYTYDHIRIDEVKDKKDLTYPALTFYLEVPKKGWWNGSGWVDYKTHFEVPLEALCWEDDFWNTSKNVKNTVESNLFIGATGYKIPLPPEMDSTEFMYFAIGLPRRFAHLADSYGGDYTGEAGNAYCFVKDLKMTIQNVYSTLYTEKDEVIENVIDGDNVVEGDEITLRLTTDNGQGYSLSTVACKVDDVLTTNFQVYAIDNELLTPEQAIIQKYVNQYSTPSIKENVTVDMSFKPHQLINDTWWNKNFIIVGQEIDYQYGKQRITLLEKK